MVTFSEAQLMAWLGPTLWAFLRILAIFTTAPLLSQRAVPVRVRIGLSLLTALAVQGHLPEGHIPLDSPAVAGVVLQQLLVGAALGVGVRVVFAAVELAGELAGLQMGLNFASFFDPVSAGNSTAVARLLTQLAFLLFVVMDGHVLLLMAITRSFETFPISDQVLGAVQALPVHRLGQALFAQALWMALPMVAFVMFVNVVMGFMSRLAPQLNVFAVGFPVTLTMGLLGLGATLPLFQAPMSQLLDAVLRLVGG